MSFLSPIIFHTLIQIGGNWDEVKKILLRTDQIPKDLKKEDEEYLKQRTEHVRYWLDAFAPDMVKFEVTKKMPKITFTEEQKEFLSTLYEKIQDIKWEPDEIHDIIYEISQEKNPSMKYHKKKTFR